MIKYLILYYLLINLTTTLIMYLDKEKSKKQKWRISEKSLFILYLLGGFLGGIIGMFKFRHKNRKIIFYFIILLAIILNSLFIYNLLIFK